MTKNGDFIYKVNIPETDWHLISSPVVGEQFDDTWNDANSINTAGAGNNEAVASYINTSDADGDWVYYQDGAGATTFGAGIGYSTKRTSAGEYTFNGGFPVSPINPTISASNIGTPATENRWTLVGNPFPAHVNIATFLSVNATPLKDSHENVYVWNAATGLYEPLTTGHIHPGQGFFVNSNVVSTTVTFTKAMQSDQNGITFYRTATNPSITLMMSDGTNTGSTEINYLADKTTGLDPRYDSGTFTGQSTSFQIYTHLVSDSKGINFMKQALPIDNYENMVIPVGLNAAAGKEITFSAEDLNLPTDLKVFLEDRETNTFTRLDEANSSYKITTSSALKGIGRFYMHTSRNSLTTKDVVLDNVSIYKTNGNTLRIVGVQQNSKTSLKLFNIVGKQVLSTSFTSNGVKDISLPKLASGVYLIQLQTDKGRLNKKIILE
ncbi:T9SS type A sorting domain-containing protein [Lutibacter sp. Hel_I_33_5]|uniref:T9SS type A sorting domain-containing protein n=1 Tax=Lutibacter sp. Hel_I_33_5 TaxID=1566289 RepID=UPI0011A132CF|nr:T9SS type A sorting domain-containing protein [Lutibacter sp. Hel_I_33_5]